MHLFLAWRVVWSPGRRGRSRRIWLIGLGINGVFLPLAMVLTLNAPAEWADWAVPCGRLAFLDLSLVFMATACLALRDAIGGILGLVGSAARLARRQAPAIPAALEALDAAKRTSPETHAAPPPVPQPAPHPATRRAFGRAILDAATFGVAALLGAIGYAQAVQSPPVRRTEVALRGRAGARGLRIVQVSDLHLGPTVRGDYLAAVVDRVLAEGPDLVAITGDLVDGRVSQLLRELGALDRLVAAVPVFYVTGNHEYFYRADEWVEALRRIGVRVLLNEHRSLVIGDTTVAIAGISDEAAEAALPDHRSDLLAAARDLPADAVKILLSHRADAAERAAGLGFDLQLCGHNHGGQFYPLVWLSQATEHHVGWFRVGAMQLHVSPGTGYWGPINRLGVPPEITAIDVVTA
ncbi:MAG: metallophosphoesterase [Nannocystaceae bacterium]